MKIILHVCPAAAEGLIPALLELLETDIEAIDFDADDSDDAPVVRLIS